MNRVKADLLRIFQHAVNAVGGKQVVEKEIKNMLINIMLLQ